MLSEAHQLDVRHSKYYPAEKNLRIESLPLSTLLRLERTQDLDFSCSSLSTIPYSESLVTYVEYEHGVKARLGRGI